MSARVARERLLRVVALAPGAVQIILPDWVPIAPAEAERFLLPQPGIPGLGHGHGGRIGIEQHVDRDQTHGQGWR